MGSHLASLVAETNGLDICRPPSSVDVVTSDLTSKGRHLHKAVSFHDVKSGHSSSSSSTGSTGSRSRGYGNGNRTHSDDVEGKPVNFDVKPVHSHHPSRVPTLFTPLDWKTAGKLQAEPESPVAPLCEDLEDGVLEEGDRCWSTCQGQCPQAALRPGIITLHRLLGKWKIESY